MSKRIVCADAVEWLKTHNKPCSIVTSLPDPEEIGAQIDEWAKWFVNAAYLSITAASDDAPAIFYQTDRKHGGQTYSKAALLIEASKAAGVKMLWHKIVLRRRPGGVDLHRPGFTHLIAFSKSGKPGKATADVMDRGKMIYANAMGMTPAVYAVKFAAERSNLIVDPFCGRGTIPAVADAFGYNAIGVDIDNEQCEKARNLKLRKGKVSA